MLDTRELGRRPGSERRVSLTVPAPADLGIEVLRVPEDSPVELELRLEAVVEGVLVTGTATAGLVGECVRCLAEVDETIDSDLTELFVYDDGKDEAADDEDDETSRLQGDLLDLEPALRDAVVLALPFQPLCREDCPGLCAECGARLADDPRAPARGSRGPAVGRPARPGRGVLPSRPQQPEHNPHEPSTDPTEEHHPRPARAAPSLDVARRRRRHGCPEAEDVAEQHASPSLAVEGRRADPGHLRQPGLRCQAPPAPCVRPVRRVRLARQPSAGSLTEHRSTDTPVTASEPAPDAVPDSLTRAGCGARARPVDRGPARPARAARPRRGPARPRPDAPVVRLRERRAAHQRAPGVPGRLGARRRGHRDALPDPPRPQRGQAGQAARGRGQRPRPGRRRPHGGAGGVRQARSR